MNNRKESVEKFPLGKSIELIGSDEHEYGEGRIEPADFLNRFIGVADSFSPDFIVENLEP